MREFVGVSTETTRKNSQLGREPEGCVACYHDTPALGRFQVCGAQRRSAPLCLPNARGRILPSVGLKQGSHEENQQAPADFSLNDPAAPGDSK
jgi:hypothetical protein